MGTAMGRLRMTTVLRFSANAFEGAFRSCANSPIFSPFKAALKCVMGFVRATKGRVVLDRDGESFELSKLRPQEIVGLGV